jgi:hypothetical protein
VATTLSATTLSRTALTALGTPSAGDVTGNVIPNGGSTFLYIANGSTERTLTISFERTVDGQSVTSRVLTVAASFTGFYRIGSIADYGANVTVTPSNADLTLKVFQI